MIYIDNCLTFFRVKLRQMPSCIDKLNPGTHQVSGSSESSTTIATSAVLTSEPSPSTSTGVTLPQTFSPASPLYDFILYGVIRTSLTGPNISTWLGSLTGDVRLLHGSEYAETEML
jgi:hypothetical protein